MKWDEMSDFEQVHAYWEFLASTGYTDDDLTFEDFNNWRREVEEMEEGF